MGTQSSFRNNRRGPRTPGWQRADEHRCWGAVLASQRDGTEEQVGCSVNKALLKEEETVAHRKSRHHRLHTWASHPHPATITGGIPCSSRGRGMSRLSTVALSSPFFAALVRWGSKCSQRPRPSGQLGMPTGRRGETMTPCPLDPGRAHHQGQLELTCESPGSLAG